MPWKVSTQARSRVGLPVRTAASFDEDESEPPPSVTADLPSGSMRGDQAENSGKMPTILMIGGWSFFFYANEGNELIHVHCRKGDAEGKYWLDIQGFETI